MCKYKNTKPNNKWNAISRQRKKYRWLSKYECKTIENWHERTLINKFEKSEMGKNSWFKWYGWLITHAYKNFCKRYQRKNYETL